jgi:threonine dehydrogenase-like Zn-dependent dehydrogenase
VPLVVVVLLLVPPVEVDCVVVAVGVAEAVAPVPLVAFGGAVVVVGAAVPDPTTSNVAGQMPKNNGSVSGSWKVIWLLWVHVLIWPVQVSSQEPIVGVGLPVKTQAVRL